MSANEALRAASVRLEQYGGHDSIPTIEDRYRCRTFSGGRYKDTDLLRCPYPNCRYARRDPVMLWRHVHMTGAHGLSFPDCRTDDDVIALAAALDLQEDTDA